MTFREVMYYTSSTIENEKLEWRRHSYLLALLANQNRGKNRRAMKPDEFYPFPTESEAPTRQEVEDVVAHLNKLSERRKNGKTPKLPIDTPTG